MKVWISSILVSGPKFSPCIIYNAYMTQYLLGKALWLQKDFGKQNVLVHVKFSPPASDNVRRMLLLKNQKRAKIEMKQFHFSRGLTWNNQSRLLSAQTVHCVCMSCQYYFHMGFAPLKITKLNGNLHFQGCHKCTAPVGSIKCALPASHHSS